MSAYCCARCGSRVVTLPEQEQRLGPIGELLALVAGGAAYGAVMSLFIGGLTALGFLYWQAWIGALLLFLALSYLAFRKWKQLSGRFYCESCGIDLPNDMVRKA